MMKNLRIGDKIANLPIVQGGMGVGISLSGLSAAVANQGGVGVIAAAGIGMFEKDFVRDLVQANINALRNEIRKAKEMTKGILGVNIMTALSNFKELVRTAIEEKIDVIFSGAGLPLNLPSLLGDSEKTRLVPIVSSGRAAGLIARHWMKKYDYAVDAVVVEGPKAGGHLGFKREQIDDPAYALENIVGDVIAEMKKFEAEGGAPVPVIAGGGVYTGEDIRRILTLGAAGVQMSTRFVTTEECDASKAFKQAYVDCKKEDIGIIKSPVGMPGRAIINRFIDHVNAGEKKPYACPFHCIVTCDVKNSPYCIACALMNAQRGNLENGFAFAGENAYRAKGIMPVKKLVEALQKEYKEAGDPDKLTIV
jgi:nitronate monooxygenase